MGLLAPQSVEGDLLDGGYVLHYALLFGDLSREFSGRGTPEDMLISR